jgi:LysM repeat protein
MALDPEDWPAMAQRLARFHRVVTQLLYRTLRTGALVSWLALLALCLRPSPAPVQAGPPPASGLQGTPSPIRVERGKGGHSQQGGRHYVVQAGDTLLSVALEIGVDLEDMACLLAPDFDWGQPLIVGDVIQVPGEPVICHRVETEETLAEIAARYGVEPALLQNPWNRLSGEPVPGTYLRVPVLQLPPERALAARVLGERLAGSRAEPISAGGRPVSRYVIQVGDTLPTVATALGLALDEIACLLAPDFQWQQALIVGDVIEVPVEPFWCHRVQPGELLQDVASRYGVPQAALAMPWNRLTGEPAPGTYLRVPMVAAEGGSWGQDGGQPSPAIGPLPDDWPYGSGQFVWPVSGWLTQGYHARHRAIDLAAPTGTPILAADRGVVLRAGWNDQGYGLFVVVDHRIDYMTLYAHLSAIAVEEGQVVKPGQIIGTVGSTGNSTGPHLHFEIRDFGYRVNPLELLPR